MSKTEEPWKWGDEKRPSDAYDTAPAGTRFLMCGYDAHPREFADGDWVRYSDYARLKAENERLRASSFVTAVPVEEYEKLKAEVENSSRINRELLVLCNQQASRVRNLIEAGDEMALGIEGDYNYPMPCVQAWNAAKDGKPTE